MPLTRRNPGQGPFSCAGVIVKPRPELDPDEVYLTTAGAAALAGVKAATIRKWVEREHLEPAGRDRRGHMLFAQMAVARAEAETRKLARRPENIAA